jgi:uncharacterized cupredoxin-like copper-binding protein
MESKVFDSLARSLARPAGRRAFTRDLGALVLAGAGAGMLRAGSVTLAEDAPAAQCPSPLDTSAAASPTASQAGSRVCVGVRQVEYAIQPDRTTFKVGQPYVFAIGNAGEMVHEFIIEPPGADEKDVLKSADGKVAKAEDIEPGKTKELTWTFTEPGDFELACHRPGHYEAGMHVAITVTA